MDLPFTSNQFFEVFKNYNTAVWPIQIFFYLLCIVIIHTALRVNSCSGKIISIILSFFWLWMGIVYNLIFFTSINKSAYIFGILFIMEAILIFYYGVMRSILRFQFRFNLYGITGSVMIFFALIIYPVLGFFLGHKYPYSPTFGLPCPTTIFTFGLFLWIDRKFPVPLLIIPFIWSVIGFTASFLLGVHEDTALLISGLVAAVMRLIKNRKPHQFPSQGAVVQD